MEKNHNKNFGKLGEDIATEYLQKKGYVVLERNYKYSRVEIDLIAKQQNEIVFVEVKTRSSDQMAYPEQAVGRAKQRNICLAANYYLEQVLHYESARFDIIAVVKNNNKFEIEHIEDAFYPFDVI